MGFDSHPVQEEPVTRSLPLSVILGTLVSDGCAQPQRSFRFELDEPGGSPMQRMAHGHPQRIRGYMAISTMRAARGFTSM